MLTKKFSPFTFIIVNDVSYLFAILYSVFTLINLPDCNALYFPSPDQSSTNFLNEYFQEKEKEEGISYLPFSDNAV